MANLRRGARRAPFVRGERRQTLWFGRVIDNAFTTVAASSVIYDSFFDAGELARRPFTIVRVRGGLYVQSDQVAATEFQVGSLGMSVVSDEASAVGITAVPLPSTDVESDKFFLWMPFATSVHVGGADGNLRGQWFPFDSRAMRKVEEGEQLAVVLENQAASEGLQYLILFRMLVKLH